MPKQEFPSTSFGEDVVLPGPGDVIAGKYRVEGVVGRGGMGVVLAAQHVQLKQPVALKMLLVHGMDESRRHEASARFVKEGQAAAQLTSEHVVRIFDVGTLEDGSPFMVMELLRGDDLATLIRRHGAAPPELALDYLAQACDAIGEAHALGIVHRDLKPSNLFVCRRSDGRAWVKVLDFGISKVLRPEQEFEGDLTATRAVVGSPLYMSPEQLRDAKRVDPRTDVWSLGMVLYELVTGGPAFEADTLLGLTAAIAADTPVPPREKRPELSEELDAIILKCLEKDPARRYQSVSEFVAAITPLLPRGPIQSGAENTSKRLESLLAEARALVGRNARSTFRGSDLQDPASVLGDAHRTAVSTGGSRPPSGFPGDATRPFGAVEAPAHEPSGPRLAIDGSQTLVSSTGSTLQPHADAAPPAPEATPDTEGAPKDAKRGLAAVLLVLLVAVGGAIAFTVSRTPAPAEPPASSRAAEPGPSAVPAPQKALPSASGGVSAAGGAVPPPAPATAVVSGAPPKAPPRSPPAPRKPPSPPKPPGTVDIKLER